MKKLLCLLLFAACPVLAQVPSGSFDYAVTNIPLWDFSGLYSHPGVFFNSGTSSSIIFQQTNGKITGAFWESDTDTNTGSYTQGAGPITGHIFWKPSSVGFTSSWTGTYNGLLNGVPYEQTVTAKGTNNLVPALPALQLSWSTWWCLLGGGCTNISGFWPATVPYLPGGMDGTWTLHLSITAVRTALTGSACIKLSNGRLLLYHLAGHYNATKQLASISLIGKGDALGTNLSITASGSQLALTKVTGNVLGQKLNFSS